MLRLSHRSFLVRQRQTRWKQLRYGQTWWGTRWLDALAQIDEENRLPRGRTYANRGAVRDLTIDGGSIEARVQGSRPQPYRVIIDVPQIAPSDGKRLAAQLAADPALIARLLNRELDPVVLQEAAALKIAVFPTGWRDLKMRCSCPDSAVPCKHLAAVIYLLSREIDGDPFLVFKLRGIDLAALLAGHGMPLDTERHQALPRDAMALFDDAQDKQSADTKDTPAHDPQGLSTLDFTRLPDLRESLWHVLPAQPVFHRGGDFRAIAQQTVARIARQARGILDSLAQEQQQEDDDDAALPEGDLRFEIIDANALPVIRGVTLSGKAVASFATLLPAVAAIAPTRLADWPAAYPALQSLNLLALHLLTNGAVAPRVHAADAPQSIGLRWIAAELDASVRSSVDQAALGLPPGLVQRRGSGKPAELSAAVRARVLLSALIDFQLRALAEPRAQSLPDDKVVALFFSSGVARFDGPGEGTLAGSIQAWLSRLHLSLGAEVPVLRIEPAKAADSADFHLSIAVAGASALEPPTPLADVIAKPAWAKRRMSVLQTVAMLAEFHPPLAGYLRSGAKQPLALRTDELPRLLFDALPAMRLIGIRTLLPRALEQLLRPRLSMQLKSKSSSAGTGLLTTGAVLSFDWKVALGDELISAAEFKRLLGKAGGIVAFRGQYVYLEPADVASLQARLARPPAPDQAELLRTALGGDYDGAPIGLNKAAAKLIDALRREADVPLPAGLQAALRPYQQRGYAWLWRNARLGLGSVLADDMGLGNTLQVLALLLRLKQDNRHRPGVSCARDRADQPADELAEGSCALCTRVGGCGISRREARVGGRAAGCAADQLRRRTA